MSLRNGQRYLSGSVQVRSPNASPRNRQVRRTRSFQPSPIDALDMISTGPARRGLVGVKGWLGPTPLPEACAALATVCPVGLPILESLGRHRYNKAVCLFPAGDVT